MIRGGEGLIGKSCSIWTSKDLVEWKTIGVSWATVDSAWLGPVVEEAKDRPDGKGCLLWAPEVWFVEDRRVCVHAANVGKANLFHNPSKKWRGPFVESMGADLGRRHDPSLFTAADAHAPVRHGLGIRHFELDALDPIECEGGLTL